MIIHCISEEKWNLVKDEDEWGFDDLSKYGFIHCSTIEYFWRVAPNFKNAKEPLLLVCIDENQLKSELRFEDGDNCGRSYPHIYGSVNKEAVVRVLPFLKDDNNNFVKNNEFINIEDK